MITYNLAPVPKWVFHDIDGELLINGYMFAYRDTVRSELKPVYQEPSGTLPYTQPIRFDSGGAAGPFYWASDENYYLEIFDSSNRKRFEIPGYNSDAGGGGPITNNIDFTNFIRDPQYFYVPKATISTLTTEQRVTNGSWYFRKSNTSATDTIQFIDFSPGDTTPPDNPQRYLRYECTVGGSSETYKDIEFRIPKVRSFQGETVSHSFWGKSPTAANMVEVRVRQHFGTGGAPSADVEQAFTTHTLSGAWQQFSIPNQIIPSIAGKSIGTNGDDYLSITLRVPLDVATTIDIVNSQLNIGTVLLPFDVLDPQSTSPKVIPYFNDLTERGLALHVDANGFLSWSPPGLIGQYIDMAARFFTPTGLLFCDGAAVSRTTYAGLFGVLCLSVTGDTVSANDTITNVTPNPITGGAEVGMPISGPGIPASTTIAALTATTIKLSQNATATATGVTIDICPWGVGDGSTTFNIPDQRGDFRRGWDAGRGVDPGRVFGSSQLDEFKSHTHSSIWVGSPGLGSGGPLTVREVLPGNLAATTATGGAETRPRNITGYVFIKAL